MDFPSKTLKLTSTRVMERVKRVIERIEPKDSRERYEKMGVHCLQGSGLIISPWEVFFRGSPLYTKSIVLATGARPFIPPILGISKIDIVTTDNLWNLRKLPRNFWFWRGPRWRGDGSGISAPWEVRSLLWKLLLNFFSKRMRMWGFILSRG